MLIAGMPVTASAQTPYRDGFLNPTDENRPLIIWQWMDGLVTKEGIRTSRLAVRCRALSATRHAPLAAISGKR